MAAVHKAALVAQLQAKCASDQSSAAQRDEENALLREQLAKSQAKVASISAYARGLADDKFSLLADVAREHAQISDHQAKCLWALHYLEHGKNRWLSNLDVFRQAVRSKLDNQENKLRKLNIEYDEELYPHLMSTIAERR